VKGNKVGRFESCSIHQLKRKSMSNSQLKKLTAERHNEALAKGVPAEVKKVNVGTIGHCDWKMVPRGTTRNHQSV
jgi:hypothetical protein